MVTTNVAPCLRSEIRPFGDGHHKNSWQLVRPKETSKRVSLNMTDADLDKKMMPYNLAGKVVINSLLKGGIIDVALRRLLLVFLDSLVLSLFALRNRVRNGSLIYVTSLEKSKNMQLLITGQQALLRNGLNQ